jgi:hypothetical protein
VIAKAHPQKEAGIMRERISQAVDKTSIRNADTKETADYLRMTKRVGYLSKATAWHFAVGMHEPKGIA